MAKLNVGTHFIVDTADFVSFLQVSDSTKRLIIVMLQLCLEKNIKKINSQALYLIAEFCENPSASYENVAIALRDKYRLDYTDNPAYLRRLFYDIKRHKLKRIINCEHEISAGNIKAILSIVATSRRRLKKKSSFRGAFSLLDTPPSASVLQGLNTLIEIASPHLINTESHHLRSAIDWIKELDMGMPVEEVQDNEIEDEEVQDDEIEDEGV